MGLCEFVKQNEKSGSMSKAETAKERRRRMYRLQSDERPAFPLQPKNFYSHVMENKEVVKTLSLLSTCTHDIRLVSAECSHTLSIDGTTM